MYNKWIGLMVVMEYFHTVKLVDCLDENMKVIHSFACSSTYDLRQACLKKRKKKIIKNLPVKNSKL